MRRLGATLAVALGALLLPAAASAAVFEVDSLADTSGGACTAAPADCTLRDALTLANGSGEADEVTFGVAGTIEPATPLPLLSAPVTLDATTAPGYVDAPVVALKATGTAVEHEGLALISGSGGSVISGLSIGGFEWGVYLADSTGSRLCGSYVGVGLDGKTAAANNTGVQIAFESSENQIGAGCGATGANLISGNSGYGVVDVGTDTEIADNGIGTDAAGNALGNGPPLGEAAGILVASQADSPQISSNTIANNRGPAVKVETRASAATIRKNLMYANSGGSIVFDDGPGSVAPELNSFVSGGSEANYTVVLTGGEPEAIYTIDLFTSSQCDPGNHGPAEVFLGEGLITTGTDGAGGGAFGGKALAGIDAEAFTVTATLNSTGETSQVSTCSYTLPETFLGKAPSGLTTSTTAEFELSGFDWGHVAGFKCSLDNAEFSLCGSPYELTGLADGTHVFKVSAFDGGGSMSYPFQGATWTVDTTPPKASIGSGPAAETTSTDAQLSFSASDATAGVEALECSLDGGAFAVCESPRQLTGLGLGSHSFAVRAVDKAGNQGSAASYSWRVEPPPGVPPPAAAEPEFRESVAVAPAGGTVFVTRPGQGPVELKEGETIPVGSVVDATNGKVTLTSVNRAGEVQTAVFYGGRFLVAEQERTGLVVLKLRGALRCGKARVSGASASAGRKGRRLWGSGKGRFRTEGNYGSATVRGTIWLTEDRCNGTFFKVRRGVVTVRDFPRDRTLALPAGKSYLAKTPG